MCVFVCVFQQSNSNPLSSQVVVDIPTNQISTIMLVGCSSCMMNVKYCVRVSLSLIDCGNVTLIVVAAAAQEAA